MTRLLGVQISHGLSSENRVFASLLAERNDQYDTVILVHESVNGSDDTRVRLGEMAHSSTVPIDTGWRPNPARNRLNPSRAKVALTYVRRIPASQAVARDLRPDVVYSSQQHYDCRTATCIARSLGVPQIIHLHYNIGPTLRRPVIDRLRTTNHVVTVSDFIRRQVLTHGVPESKVTTIRNTMRPFPDADPERVAAIRRSLGLEGSFTFAMVGRLDESKGHLDAIAALERADRDDIKLVIVGSGRIDDVVRRRAAESSTAHRIVFTGQRPDVPEVLASVDALLHPATQDPCPLAVLEAMAAGRPVVGYDDGGVPEEVVHGETGVLVPHQDVRGLAAAIAELRDDPSRSVRMGFAGRDRLVAEFRPEDAGARFADLVVATA